MTLSIKYANGFETGLVSGQDGGQLSIGGVDIRAAAARSGDYGVRVDANDTFTITPADTDFTKAIHFGFAMQTLGTYTSDISFASIWQQGIANYITLYYNATSNMLEIGKSTGTVSAPSPSYSFGVEFVDNVWNYIEIAFLINDSTGAIKAKQNGVLVVDESGIDTQNTGTAPSSGKVNAILRAGSGLSPDSYFDDVVIAEASSTTLELLGEVAILPGRPDSAVTSDMTGSDANQVDNHLLVDEHPPASADYVESSTIGHQDTYGTDLAIASGTTILGVQVKATVFKDVGGERTMGLYVKEGVTEDTSAGKGVSVSETIISEIWETNPDTAAAWTVAEVNAVEIGVEVVS